MTLHVAGLWRYDITIFRPSSGQWFVSKSTGGSLVVTWGLSTDIPVSGDWDGDGTSDFSVWRPGIGVWFTQLAKGGTIVVGWGVTGDKPVGRVPGSLNLPQPFVDRSPLARLSREGPAEAVQSSRPFSFRSARR